MDSSSMCDYRAMLALLLLLALFVAPLCAHQMVYSDQTSVPGAPAASGCGGSGSTPIRRDLDPSDVCSETEFDVAPFRRGYRSMLRCARSAAENDSLTLYSDGDITCSRPPWARFEGRGGECTGVAFLQSNVSDTPISALDVYRVSVAIHCDDQPWNKPVTPVAPPFLELNSPGDVQLTLFASEQDRSCSGNVTLQTTLPLGRCAPLTNGMYARAQCNEDGSVASVRFFDGGAACAQDLQRAIPFLGLNDLSCADASYAMAMGAPVIGGEKVGPVFASVRCHLDTREPTHLALFNANHADPVVVTQPLNTCLRPHSSGTSEGNYVKLRCFPITGRRYVMLYMENFPNASCTGGRQDVWTVEQFTIQGDWVRQYTTWAGEEQQEDGENFVQCIVKDTETAEASSTGDSLEPKPVDSASAPDAGGVAVSAASFMRSPALTLLLATVAALFLPMRH